MTRILLFGKRLLDSHTAWVSTSSSLEVSYHRSICIPVVPSGFREWDVDLLSNLFPDEDAYVILSIPLCQNDGQDNVI